MVKVNFATSDYQRQVAGADSLLLKNRYFEQNPFLTDDGAALIARPGMRRLTEIGDGPIRGMHSEAGSFNGDLFIASGAELYRMDNKLTATFIYNGLYDPLKGFVNMAITANIGDVSEFLFVADGRNLFVYTNDGYSHNALTGTPANNDVVRIDSIYYRWTNGSVDVGTPAGTLANPWLVALGVTTLQAFTNIAEAINGNGSPGVTYSTSLTPHTTVEAFQWSSTSMSVQAITPGPTGDSIVTTETGASISWASGGTLTGGGSPTLHAVQTPDDVGVIDVAVIGSYVIVIPVQANGLQGRFYWIEPGETTIDPLNFATAESSPDGIYGVEVLGDQFWLPGETTTEVWYPTGDTETPLRRLQGVVFNRGSWQNTPVAVHENLVIVDPDGAVFLIRGGSPERVSNPAIEEEIRTAISAQSGFLS